MRNSLTNNVPIEHRPPLSQRVDTCEIQFLRRWLAQDLHSRAYGLNWLTEMPSASELRWHHRELVQLCKYSRLTDGLNVTHETFITSSIIKVVGRSTVPWIKRCKICDLCWARIPVGLASKKNVENLIRTTVYLYLYASLAVLGRAI